MFIRLKKKRSQKVGLPPGTLVHVGERRSATVALSRVDYSEGSFREQRPRTIEECLAPESREAVTWINIGGVHRSEILEKLGSHFHIHPLVLEDIMNTSQRPKLEDMGGYLFLVLKMLTFREEPLEIEIEQISLLLGPDFVISLQETEEDVFGPVRERIRSAKGMIRKAKADYLAYALLDAVVDNYFPLFERIDDLLEDIEEKLLLDPTPETSMLIHALKRDMIFLRRSIWPLREVISRLDRTETDLVQPATRIYLRDVYDHVIHSIETIETSREMIASLLEAYLSSVSNRLNEVIKVLTIIATIFMPLTFITGIYGMNFSRMPELSWPWAYPVAFWTLMALLAGLMIGFFRRRNWL